MPLCKVALKDHECTRPFESLEDVYVIGSALRHRYIGISLGLISSHAASNGEFQVSLEV
jgi:hypothetical protein